MTRRDIKTILYRVGLRWHWRIISAWDHTEIASGSASKRTEAEQTAINNRKKLYETNNHRD